MTSTGFDVGLVGVPIDNPDDITLLTTVIGDMDLDGDVDTDDADDFVLGLIDPARYLDTFGTLPTLQGDIDGNGLFDENDIDDFVALVSPPAPPPAANLTAVPEPSTLALAFLALLGLVGYRRRV